MASSKQIAVNPFAAAKTTGSTAKLAQKAGVYVAQDAEQIQAIVDYCKGHELEDTGKSMKLSSRPVLLNFAMQKFTREWLQGRKRPANPTIASGNDATSSFISVNFIDKALRLDAERYSVLANLIGSAQAEENTVKMDVFTLNSELLEQTAKVSIDGKIQQMRVMDAIGLVLQKAFAPSPEIVGDLFTKREVFETKKGIIDAGPSLVAPDATPSSQNKLIEFMEVACASPQVKPKSSGIKA